MVWFRYSSHVDPGVSTNVSHSDGHKKAHALCILSLKLWNIWNAKICHVRHQNKQINTHNKKDTQRKSVPQHGTLLEIQGTPTTASFVNRNICPCVIYGASQNCAEPSLSNYVEEALNAITEATTRFGRSSATSSGFTPSTPPISVAHILFSSDVTSWSDAL